MKALSRLFIVKGLKEGLITKQPCAICGSTGRTEAHHNDYRKLLEVEWLCPEHHRLRHTAPLRNNNIVSHILRNWRVREQIGQQKFAAMIGMNVTRLNKIESGNRKFPKDFVPRLPEEIREAVAMALGKESSGAN